MPTLEFHEYFECILCEKQTYRLNAMILESGFEFSVSMYLKKFKSHRTLAKKFESYTPCDPDLNCPFFLLQREIGEVSAGSLV